MLDIERIRLQLPAGFGHRAASIARLVGESLADFHATENRDLQRLSIGPVQVSAQATDRDIAQRIAAQIVTTLGRRG